MKIGKSRSWVLWYVSFGFALMILLSWLDELIGLSRIVFGGEPHVSDWRDATMQSLLIITVWVVVLLVMKKLVAHLLYLEGFLKICAWCRRVGYEDKWLPLERYFEESFHVETSHGMCPECFEKIVEHPRKRRRKRVKNKPGPDGNKASS
jgi:hypothetical protein